MKVIDLVTQGGSSRQPRPQGLLAFQEDPGDEVVSRFLDCQYGGDVTRHPLRLGHPHSQNLSDMVSGNADAQTAGMPVLGVHIAVRNTTSVPSSSYECVM